MAALLLASVGAISYMADDGSAAPGASAVPASSTESEAWEGRAAKIAPVPVHAAEIALPGVTPLRPTAAEPERPPHRSGTDALPPETHRARISFRAQMAAGLAGIQKRVARCSPNAAFRLDLETVADGIRVVDVQPEPEVTNERDLACARSALKGKVIPAQDAEPGRRWQMPLVVQPSR